MSGHHHAGHHVHHHEAHHHEAAHHGTHHEGAHHEGTHHGTHHEGAHHGTHHEGAHHGTHHEGAHHEAAHHEGHHEGTHHEDLRMFGHWQSPIDIKTQDTKFNSGLQEPALECNYRFEEKMLIENNGHTVMASMKADSTVSGGPFKDRTYKLAQFHFHWGSDDKKGSEHTVDGKRYSGELHFVHYNHRKYTDLSHALRNQDGLAVLGVFIKVGKENEYFDELTEYFEKITDGPAKTNVHGRFYPKHLLPENTSEYWTYLGSLTTDPFSETVTWVVFRHPIEVSEPQLVELRSLLSEKRDHIENNYRETNPINYRPVEASFR